MTHECTYLQVWNKVPLKQGLRASHMHQLIQTVTDGIHLIEMAMNLKFGLAQEQDNVQLLAPVIYTKVIILQ